MLLSEIAMRPPHKPMYARAQQLVATAIDEAIQPLTCKAIMRITGLSESDVRKRLSELEDMKLIVREQSEALSRNPMVWRAKR